MVRSVVMPDGTNLTEEMAIRVQRMDPTEAKISLEEKEAQLQQAAQFLEQRHEQITTMERNLEDNGQRFNEEVRVAQNQYVEVKDELSVFHARARQRTDALEARLATESSTISHHKAALLNEAHVFQHEKVDFNEEVRVAQNQYVEVKDELSASHARARQRTDALEAQLATEANTISQHKAVLLNEAHVFQHEKSAFARTEAGLTEDVHRLQREQALVQGRELQLQDSLRDFVQKEESQAAGFRKAEMLQELTSGEKAHEIQALSERFQAEQNVILNEQNLAREAERALVRREQVVAEQQRHVSEQAVADGQGSQQLRGRLREEEVRRQDLERQLAESASRLAETREAATELRDAVQRSEDMYAADYWGEGYHEDDFDVGFDEPQRDGGDHEENDSFTMVSPLDAQNHHLHQRGFQSSRDLLAAGDVQGLALADVPVPAQSSAPASASATVSAPGAAAPPSTRPRSASPHPRVPVREPSPHRLAGSDDLKELVRSLAESVATLAGTTVQGRTGQLDALERLADAAQDSKRTLRPDKPKLTAANPATLHLELKALRLYFNDAKIHERCHWLSGARAVASGRALVTFNKYMVQKFGSEQAFQDKLKEKAWPEWDIHWKAFEDELKYSTGLDDACELSEAVSIYNSVSLKNKSSMDAADHFVQDYTSARTLMIEQGLLVAHDPLSRVREIEDIKRKLEGSDVLRYLLELPEFPAEVDDIDPSKRRHTIIGRIRQWISARRGPGMHSASSSAKDDKHNVFLKNQLKKVTALLQDPPSQSNAQQLQFDDGKRFRASRDPSKGGSKGGRSGPKGGGGDCPRCQGTHPECSVCPNTAATAETGFDVSAHAKEKRACWFDHLKKGKPCGGYGHVARHHMAPGSIFTPTARFS